MYNSKFFNTGERLWLPIIAGAAILAAPFWLNRQNNQPCCGNNYPPPYPYYGYPTPYPQPVPQPIPQPYPYPYPYPYPEPYPVFSPRP